MKKSHKPKILLHACCAPCLTAVYEKIKDDYEITIYWFNPNIYPIEEYQKRLAELERFCLIRNIPLVKADQYAADNISWNHLADNVASEPEGGKRCLICFKYRLLMTAKYANEHGFDLFGTTLSISPHKNATQINEIGAAIADKFEDLKFLAEDFSDRYKRSIEMCKEYDLYRQNYCGCQFSIRTNSKVKN